MGDKQPFTGKWYMEDLQTGKQMPVSMQVKPILGTKEIIWMRKTSLKKCKKCGGVTIFTESDGKFEEPHMSIVCLSCGNHLTLWAGKMRYKKYKNAKKWLIFSWNKMGRTGDYTNIVK